jgi:asparagine synthase (glutamine-hydrolysing)
LFDSRFINKLWHEHQTRKADHGIVLWSMLMYQMWFERYALAQEVTQQ